MESLSEILSGTTVSDESASVPAATADTATDVKPAEQAASASSAEPAKTEAKADKVEDKSAQTRDEKGRFDKPDEKGAKDEITAIKAALHAERKKRQELERKAKEQPKDDKPKKDFWEDPEAALEERLTPLKTSLQQESDTRFFNLCERLAKSKHTDYDDVLETLMQDTEADPDLARRVFTEARQSDDPAEFLYSHAKYRSEMKAVGGDLGKFKETVAAPLKERITKLEDENKALKEKLEKLGKVPSSLNSQPSATRAAVESEAVEHESLAEITKPRKRRA